MNLITPKGFRFSLANRLLLFSIALGMIPALVIGLLTLWISVQNLQNSAFAVVNAHLEDQEYRIQGLVPDYVSLPFYNPQTNLNLLAFAQPVKDDSQKVQGTTLIESALKITAKELGQVLGKKPTLVRLNASSQVSQKED